MGYSSEPPIPVLEIVEPESNREGVSRLRSDFKTGGYGYGSGSEPPVFRQFFTVFQGSEPPIFVIFYGSSSVSRFSGGFSRFRSGTVRNCENLEPGRTTVLKVAVSVRFKSHGFYSENRGLRFCGCPP